jgi:diguanylate cyclase (GGDEF)-like protein
VWQQAQRDRQTLSVIMIDIDYFKAYNDRYGPHRRRRLPAARVSSALRDAARRPAAGFVARYGGEELAAVLYGADKAYGEINRRAAFSRRCASCASRTANSEAQPVNVTVSVGVVSEMPHRITTHDARWGSADQALYAAKPSDGRDRYVAM